MAKPKRKKMDTKHLLFVTHFTKPGAPTFDNATLSYALVYKPDMFKLSRDVDLDEEDGAGNSPFDKAYNVCRAMGSRLLAKVSIQDAIQKRLLKLFGDNDTLDTRLAQLAFQNEDRHVALGAIRDANKLKKRVNDDPLLPPGAQPITRIEIVMPAEAKK